MEVEPNHPEVNTTQKVKRRREIAQEQRMKMKQREDTIHDREKCIGQMEKMVPSAI